MDLLLGRFADAYIADLGDRDLAHFEALMELPDDHLLAWLTGRAPVAADHATQLFAAIVEFHATRHEQD